MTVHGSACRRLALTAWPRRLGVALLTTVLAAAPNPGVLAPPGPHYGLDYRGWVAAWSQWANEQPDGPRADCGPSGTGPVWFLNQGGGPPVAASCALPAGTPLFVPILAGECSASANQGKDEAALRACAKANLDGLVVAEATLDGVPLQDVQQYHVTSALMTITHPTRPVDQRVAEGYWFLLAPLAPGTHTLTTHSWVNLRPDGTDTYYSTVTYTLTVAGATGGALPNLPNTGAGGPPAAPFAGLGLALAFGGLLLAQRTRRGTAATPRA
jgi:LPXTG-motif cell wall-anchored protein